MCDFHDCGLIFAGQMHCLPQRLKSTGTLCSKKISNNVDFSLWGSRATTWEYFLTFSSETKIMKITHSEDVAARPAYEVPISCWSYSLVWLMKFHRVNLYSFMIILGMGQGPYFRRAPGLGSFFLAWTRSWVKKILLESCLSPKILFGSWFSLNIIQI